MGTGLNYSRIDQSVSTPAATTPTAPGAKVNMSNEPTSPFENAAKPPAAPAAAAPAAAVAAANAAEADLSAPLKPPTPSVLEEPVKAAGEAALAGFNPQPPEGGYSFDRRFMTGDELIQYLGEPGAMDAFSKWMADKTTKTGRAK